MPWVSPLSRFLVYDVFLSAALPVGLVALLYWTVSQRMDINEQLGDGQLCLYSTTLVAITMSDLFATHVVHPYKAWLVTALITVIICATALWAVAVVTRGSGFAVQVSKARLTKASLWIALFATLTCAYIRWIGVGSVEGENPMPKKVQTLNARS